MPTLDEVIKAIEFCCNDLEVSCEDCPAFEEPDCRIKYDALNYLKAYKDDRNDLTVLRAYWKEQHENPELTWDELRQMEGKPVWIEPVKEWMLLTEVEGRILWLLRLNGQDYDLSLNGWQAYRKERE